MPINFFGVLKCLGRGSISSTILAVGLKLSRRIGLALCLAKEAAEFRAGGVFGTSSSQGSLVPATFAWLRHEEPLLVPAGCHVSTSDAGRQHRENERL